ncbi:hypothetical protein [Duganella vulcania]|uniref:Uncharacterized protein n=1 Tax=Duganella vulcania TaxID=2692166 RepID=A0A845GNY8_9BURK|nr:hypothetical protein [Duganella vulcania]MYM96253.1 hypothetical protein [Duganella vulcania]
MSDTNIYNSTTVGPKFPPLKTKTLTLDPCEMATMLLSLERLEQNLIPLVGNEFFRERLAEVRTIRAKALAK